MQTTTKPVKHESTYQAEEACMDNTGTNDNAHQFYYPDTQVVRVVTAKPEKDNTLCLLPDSLNDISCISSDEAEDGNIEETVGQ